MFQKATKEQAFLRLGLCGPAGSGKTFTALRVAAHIAKQVGGRVAVLDTEHGSASKYADLFDFDVTTPPDFGPLRYAEVIEQAVRHGYAAVVLDSLSHAWVGRGGALEQVDAAGRRGDAGKFGAWRDVTPQHNKMIEAILSSPIHVIATLRSKMDYAMEQQGGKTTVRKVGMAPIQREGMEYEFDVVGDLDTDNYLAISKTRCRAIRGNAVIHEPGEEFAQTLLDWCRAGAPRQDPPAPTGSYVSEGRPAPRPTAVEYHASRTGQTTYSTVTPACPKCHGPMWDNRASKKRPEHDDFRCKDRERCDGAWPVGAWPRMGEQEMEEIHFLAKRIGAAAQKVVSDALRGSPDKSLPRGPAGDFMGGEQMLERMRRRVAETDSEAAEQYREREYGHDHPLEQEPGPVPDVERELAEDFDDPFNDNPPPF